MTPDKSPRLAAAELIKRIVCGGAYSNIAIGDSLTKLDCTAADRALCTRIVMTAAERVKTLDYVIEPFCRKKPDPVVRALLYTGAVQILYMDRVPDSAACDETVEAAKALVDVGRVRFVNAVLRNICRAKDEILAELQNVGEDVRYSVDGSVLALLKEQYPCDYKNMLNAMFLEQPLFLRPNTLKLSPTALADMLEAAGCAVGEKDGFMYVSSGASKALSMLGDGLFFVQGYASQYAVRLLGAKPNETVVDVCACPGGKTAGAALDMKNSGRIFAFDLHEKKLPLIEKTAATLGIDIITTSKNDGRMPVFDLLGKADRVICDVPCSALGIMPSRPEIRYKDVSDLSALIKTQYDILCASVGYLKSGGTLLYSTCTFDKNENDGQIKRFMTEHDGFSVCEERTFLPDGITDGFYCCRIVKNA